MSHITTVDIEIRDLSMLEAACRRCGLEFRRGQVKFKWWGRDKRCEHAIGVPGDERAYEIGIVRKEDGRDGYQFLYDDHAGGHGLMALCGKGCSRLKQAYAVEVAMAEAMRQGMNVNEQAMADGTVRLVCTG